MLLRAIRLLVALLMVFGEPLSPMLVLAASAVTNPLEVLTSRPAWTKLPREVLDALAKKLGSAKRASEFALLCEKANILEDNIYGLVDLAGSDAEFIIGGIATSLTSYANTMGDQRRFPEARQALEFAVLLKPRAVAAWGSMALVAINTGDCRTASYWADRVLAFKPDPNSRDSWERGIAAAMTPEGEQRAAEFTNQPEMVGAWKQGLEMMRAIKNDCRKRSGSSNP